MTTLVSELSLNAQQPSCSPQPFYIAPSIGKQYINEDLPNYSLILSQNYVEILTMKEFITMFSSTTQPFSDLPNTPYSNFVSFVSLYNDLKSGYYDLSIYPPSTIPETTSEPLIPIPTQIPNPKFQKQLHANCKQMIYSSQYWNSSTHNPLFTSFSADPNPKYPYIANTSNISNLSLVQNEFQQLCHPITHAIHKDSIVLRMTTTAHAIVFDIINIQRDPFFAYHSRNSFSSSSPLPTQAQYPSAIQLPSTTPTSDINDFTLTNKMNRDQQISNHSGINLLSPLSISQIIPSKSPQLNQNNNHQSFYPTSHQNFDYFCLQPVAYTTIPSIEATLGNGSDTNSESNSQPDSTDAICQLHTLLYGSFSLKFIIPLGSLLAAPIQQFAQLSFSHHMNRFSSQQYQPLPHNLDSILTSGIGVNNSLLMKQICNKRLTPLISSINTHLKNLQGQYGLPFQQLSTSSNDSTDSTIIDMTSSVETPALYQLTSAQASLSTIYLSIPDDPKMINLVKHESHKLRQAQQYADTLSQSPDMSRDQVLLSPSAQSNQQGIFSPGGAPPLNPALPNKYGLPYPRELKDNTNGTTTALHIVSVCTLYNSPIITTWQQQYQLLNQLEQNNIAMTDYQPIPQLTSNDDRCKDICLTKLHTLHEQAQFPSNKALDRRINAVPSYTHYSRHQIAQLMLTLDQNPSTQLIQLLTQTTPPTSFSLPTLLSLLHLFSQQLFLQDTIEKLFVQNAKIAAITSTSTATQTLANILSHPSLTYPLLYTSPITAAWSILALPRPRSLIAAVNPFGGAGKAVHYLQSTYPLFYASNHQCYIFITQYGGDVIERTRVSQCAFGWDGDPHKKQFYEELIQLQRQELQNPPTIVMTDSLLASTPGTIANVGSKLHLDHFYDTFLCFSGDGLLNELINGIMKSHHWSFTLSRMALSHIPTGSGNGVASTVSSVSFYSTAPENAVHLALHGCSRKLDMFTVSTDPKRPNGKGYTASETQESEQFQTKIDGFDSTVLEPKTQWEHEDNGEYDPQLFTNAEFFTKHYASELKLSEKIQLQDLVVDNPQFILPPQIPISQPVPRGVYCGILSLSWAFISDLDFESEKWRWCGGARFECAAVLRILWLRKYKARIEILVDDMNDDENLTEYLKSHKMKIPKSSPDATRLTAEEFRQNLEEQNPQPETSDLNNNPTNTQINIDNLPSNRLTACGMNCQTCRQSFIDQFSLQPEDRDSSRLEGWSQNKLHFSSRASILTHDLGTIHGNFIVKSDQEPLESNQPNNKIIPEKWFPLYSENENTDNLSEEDHKLINEDYTCIWGVNLSHGTSDTIISPFSHFNDGHFDLYYIKDCGRMDLLNMLTSINSGSHVNSLAVEHVKVKGLRFDPTVTCDGGDKQLPDNSCLMSLDGERIPLKSVELRTWNGVINLISRL